MRSDWVSLAKLVIEQGIKRGMDLLKFLDEVFWVMLDLGAPFIWESGITYRFISCDLCGSNIVPGKVRDVYIMDNRMIHYTCPCCGVDYFYYVNIIPIPADQDDIQIYYQRYEERSVKTSTH